MIKNYCRYLNFERNWLFFSRASAFWIAIKNALFSLPCFIYIYSIYMALKDFHFPWVQFIIGGVLFSLIKIISERVSDVRIASIVAAFRIGLISSFMIEKDKRAKYVFSYSINLCVLLIVAGIFLILL